MHQNLLVARILGFATSVILTCVSFFIIIRPVFFHLQARVAVFVVFILAILQFIVQFFFFIDLWSEKGMRWNLIIFASTISIVLIIVLGSILIMNQLDYNMK